MVITGGVPTGRAGLCTIDPDLAGCKAGQETEDHGEGFTAAQPLVTAKQEHAEPGDDAVIESRRGQRSRLVAFRPDQLGPHEGSKQHHSRPLTQPLRPRQVQTEDAATEERLPQPFHPCERRGPGIDGLPQVAGEAGDVGESNPPDNPDRGWGDVLKRILVAYPSGDDDERQESHGKQPEQRNQKPAGEDTAGLAAEYAEPRIAGDNPIATHEKRDHHERQRDRGRGATHVETQWNRQIVTLGESVCQQTGGRQREQCGSNSV
jgi:hypothetical protein